MTALDIQTSFPVDLDAVMYFERMRWGDTTRCAYCNTTKVSKRQTDGRFHCSQCRKTFSVTTGTFLHSSKLPLKIWMNAFSILSNNEDKISIKQLQHGLMVSYTTAWRIRHEISTIIGDDFKQGDPRYRFESLCRKAISEYKVPEPVLEEAVV